MIEYYNYRPSPVFTNGKQLVVTVAYDKTEVDNMPPWEKGKFWGMVHELIREAIIIKTREE